MKHNLVHRTLSSAIAEQLRQGVLSGAYAAGSALRQDMLAAQYGVSRIPVREALFQLEAEGLVLIAPHKGAIVSNFSLAEVDDVFDLRVLLEPRLLRSSAPLLTAADCANIAELDDAFAKAIAEQDVAHWGELNARFHQALYRHAPLPRTLAIVTQLLQTSERYTRVQMNRANPDKALPRAEREHRKLLQLCRSGQVDQACAHLVGHIEAVRKDLHRLLKPASKPTPPTRRKTAA
jgi:DNA-binding GntR family transcriptional regulator